MFFRSPPWDSVVYWALDLETGGLDPAQDPVIAVGMVPVRAGLIRLREAYRTLVRPSEGSAVGARSVRAHQLVRRDLEGAPTLESVMPEIDRRIREGVILVHHAAIDIPFLRRDFKRAGLAWPSRPVVDTRELVVRSARLRDLHRPHELLPLDLSLARAEHGLPDYQAHEPLADAIAAAELFLAVRAAIGARTLRDVRA